MRLLVLWSLLLAAVASNAWAVPTVRSKALEGPYESLDMFCAKRPRGHRCELDRGWTVSSPAQWPGKGAILDVRLFIETYRWPSMRRRLRSCRLALRTTQGWFVRLETEPCHGTSGRNMGSPVDRVGVDLSWSGDEENPIAAISTAEEWETIEDHTNPFKPDNRDVRLVLYLRRDLFLCAVGTSGVPSCTAAFLLRCSSEGKRIFSADWSVDAGALTLRSRRDEPGWCGPLDINFFRGTRAVLFK